MANKSIIADKAAKAAIIKEKIDMAQSVIIVDYRGYTVAEVSELRKRMRAAGVEYSVLKNSIVERAAAQSGIDASINEYLKGPSAFAFGLTDAVAPAKILKDYIKQTKKGVLKGGIVNGKVQDAKSINTLADLPSRDVLIARLLGSMKAPITGLAVALGQIKEQKEAAAQ